MAKGYKTGGRKKGTPNKLSKELITILKDIMYEELENIQGLLNELEPKERLELLVKLLPFALPKVYPVNHQENEPITFDFE